jgi:hypothetical protein
VSAKKKAAIELGADAGLALDTILRKPTQGIPSGALINIMEHAQIERLAGLPAGSYRQRPEETYLAMQRAIGACMIDQWIPTNPLKMDQGGLHDAERGATTGAERIECDGMLIDSPEAVVEHMEKHVFPALEKSAASLDVDEDEAANQLVEQEREVQALFGPEMLKVPYGRGFGSFPCFRYGGYGYVNYFCAYALYPEVMAKDFRLQADLAVKRNQLAVRAYELGQLPPLLRLDHDMADSRSTLVDIKSLDQIWFPEFARAIEPYLQAGIKLIWHCDGNLSQMVPRLLEAGLSGFQGFQYEDGMDYERICRMKTRDGDSLLIVAGVSVTRTLPLGTPADVRKEMKWLVENGPETGLFLAASSSVAPGVPPENLDAFVEGLKHYREHGRN